MDSSIRKVLKKCIKSFMKSNKINWGNIQNGDIKERFKIPVGWRTLHKVMKDPKYNTMHVNSQSDLLKFFNIPHTKEFGIITLSKQNEND